MLRDFSSSPTALPTGRLSRLQYVVTVSARLRNTPACLLLYLVLILLNLFVIAFEWRGGSVRHPFAITLETIINVFLVAEVLTSILQQRAAYWHQTVNVIDFVLTALCVVFFVLFLSRPPSPDSDSSWSDIDVVLMIARYCFQLSRISVLIWRGRKTTDALTQEDIDFTVHEMRDKIDQHLTEHELREKKAAAAAAAAAKPGKGKGDGQVEKQQLLDHAVTVAEHEAEDSSGSSSSSSGRAVSDDGKKQQQQHERALAAIELQIKRHARSSEEGEDDATDGGRSDGLEAESKEASGPPKRKRKKRVAGGKSGSSSVSKLISSTSGVPVKRAISPMLKTAGRLQQQRAGAIAATGSDSNSLQRAVSVGQMQEGVEEEDLPADEVDSEV